MTSKLTNLSVQEITPQAVKVGPHIWNPFFESQTHNLGGGAWLYVHRMGPIVTLHFHFFNLSQSSNDGMYWSMPWLHERFRPVQR